MAGGLDPTAKPKGQHAAETANGGLGNEQIIPEGPAEPEARQLANTAYRGVSRASVVV